MPSGGSFGLSGGGVVGFAGLAGLVAADHLQAGHQVVEVSDAQQLNDHWQARPVNAAHAVGQKVPGLHNKGRVFIPLGLVFALVLDAGLGIQQGRQFFA